MSPPACVPDAQIDSLRMLSNDDNKENDPTSTNIWKNHRARLRGHKNALNLSDQKTEAVVDVCLCLTLWLSWSSAMKSGD